MATFEETFSFPSEKRIRRIPMGALTPTAYSLAPPAWTSKPDTDPSKVPVISDSV